MSEILNLAEQERKAEAIVAKYHHDLGELYQRATALELRTVMMYVANEANHKQRVVAGLDKETKD
jgi:hypothetical protein